MRGKDARVEFDEHVVSVVRERAWTIRWADVRRIEAYKRDLFTVDQVVVRLVRQDEEALEVDEDMDGFKAFEPEMRKRFTGIDEGWLMRVAQPPFAVNSEVLWRIGGE